ncbi:hypothetical protein [Aeromonas hydrophila]|uniref:hypothetical protein n=1 Tax=Aeromonas hydrophila TaxID=644 RepID=UPI001F3725A4|nr:hypothetical protein [Aeromonas hydrophila]
MLSENLINYLRDNGWWFEEVSIPYKEALESIGLSADSQIGFFYLHAEDGPHFISQKGMIYQLCWFVLNTDYGLAAESLRKSLCLPPNLIPLDSFEGEGGFFYNKESGQVFELSIGESLSDFLDGKPTKKWRDFNSFIEDFFDI